MAGQVVIELTAEDKVSGVINKINSATAKLDRSVKESTAKLNQGFQSAGKVQEVFAAKVVNTEAAIKKQIAALRQVQQNALLGGQTYQKAGQQIEAYQAKLNTAANAANKKVGVLGRLKQSAVGAGQALAALGAAAAVKGFAQAGIEADRTAKRLKFLGDQYGETDRLQEIASQSAKKFAIGQTDAEKAVSDLFARLRPMGVELDDIGTVFEGVNVAAKQMSLSTADTEGVMLQLSQALGSGKLQGDEFRSVMERLPKIGQAVAKSMGVQVQELKSLSSAGAITTEEIIKALKNVQKEGFPPPDSVMAFNKAIADLSTAIGQRLTPVLSPILDAITGLVNNFLALPEPVQAAVIAFTGIGTAFAVIVPLLPAIVAGIAAIVTTLTGPVGIIAAIGGAAAAFLTMKGKAAEAKEPVKKVKDETNELKAATEAAAIAKQKFINKSKEAVQSVQQEQQQMKAAEQAFENSVNLTNARLQAEQQINNLQLQGLNIAYENATSAQQRLAIAKEIFQNEIDGAQIAYEQTLNSIEAEQRRLEFRRQAAELEARMIQAKGELAAAEADSAEKAALIMEKTRQAVEVQRDNVRLIDGQISAQSKIAEQQKLAADAQYKMTVNTAEQSLKQKLVSDEIGMSEQKAAAMAGRMGDSVRNSNQLVSVVGQVSNNASNAAHSFIAVADNAAIAAEQINRAAAAQERLNRAKAGSKGGGGGGKKVKKQAKGGYNKGAFQAFAQGGVVSGPTLGLIGEGGEPEYIIPQSKAAGFAANFLSGKRGAGAIPGFAEGGVAMPSTASVSIQTGPVTQMEGKNFVTTQQMAQAVEAGVMQTLEFLQNDGMVRGSLGL